MRRALLVAALLLASAHLALPAAAACTPIFQNAAWSAGACVEADPGNPGAPVRVEAWAEARPPSCVRVLTDTPIGFEACP